MDYFEYKEGVLFAESVALEEVAKRFGTPTYVYSRATLTRHFKAFDDAFSGMPHLVCYAVKANSNLAVLQVLAKLGAGFDIVSGGELDRVLRAGGNPSRVVFSGIGKTESEIRQALTAGIHCFNVESENELLRLETVAKSMNKVAPVALRVNPDVDPKTHPYISTGLKENKFGVSMESAVGLYQQAQASPHLKPTGVGCHIGSQLLDIQPFMDALDRLLALVDELKALGIEVEHVDVGGGLGVPYSNENAPSPATLANAVKNKLSDRNVQVLLEPGRAIAGNAGVLLTRVDAIKKTGFKTFCIVDAAMNDLLRPSLYQAFHNIVPVRPRAESGAEKMDIVGPVCETGDFLGKDRNLAVQAGDYLAVRTAGAYGFTMSSNYNSRPRAAEIMVDGSVMHVVRERETYDDLVRGEKLL